jgi:CTP:molybdopterin cytidylyltransferase MocA
MHSPGVCGAILVTGPFGGAAGAPWKDESEAVGKLIDALNADTDMVLVALAAGAESLAPAVWEGAAYVVQLAPGVSDASALRALLQEALNRGRDAVLVTALDGPELSAELVRRIVTAYRTAGDEIWAVVPETALAEAKPRYPFLLGREMIQLFQRGQSWTTADEIFSAHREHVHAMKASGPDGAAVVLGKSWPASGA